MPTPQEHDYIGLAESSSSSSLMERSSDKISSSPPPPPPPPSSSSSSALSATTEDEKIKETELRLGLPGSHSPDRKPGLGGVPLFGKDLDEKHGTNNNNNKTLESGLKRGFSDAIDGKWVFSHARNGSEVADLGKGSPLSSSTALAKKEAASEKKPQQVSEHSSPPAAKAQVVGWPPIRSYRKNSMASNLGKSNEETEDKSGSGCLYVKVSMDGAPYLRKVDLKTCTNYMELSLALEKMFSCFSIGQCGTPGLPERNGLTASRLMDLLHGSENVVTYEDKDGDWMLVGDVPWGMFIDTCRRLRIMKGSEAIGLAPRTKEKCKNQN